MRRRVVWSPTALRQVARIYSALDAVHPVAAGRLVDRLMEVGERLAEFPYRGRAVPGTRMRETVVAHPYVVRYRIQADEVRILRVRHGARRPTKL